MPGLPRTAALQGPADDEGSRPRSKHPRPSEAAVVQISTRSRFHEGCHAINGTPIHERGGPCAVGPRSQRTPNQGPGCVVSGVAGLPLCYVRSVRHKLAQPIGNNCRFRFGPHRNANGGAGPAFFFWPPPKRRSLAGRPVSSSGLLGVRHLVGHTKRGKSLSVFLCRSSNVDPAKSHVVSCYSGGGGETAQEIETGHPDNPYLATMGGVDE